VARPRVPARPHSVGRRILISGYYGFNNLGDEAVLAATAAELRRLLPDAEITVLSASPAETSRAHGVRAISRRDPARILRAVAACDLFLSGGGSLYQDATSWRSPFYYLGLLATAELLRRRTVVYAQGVEPANSRSVRSTVAFLLNHVDLITVRDATSVELLSEMGIRRPRIVLSADPSLLLTPQWTDAAVAERTRWGDGMWCGLALRPWATQGLLRTAAEGARAAAQRLGNRWALLPMHPASDLSVCEALAADLGSLATVVRVPVHPREMLALIGSLALVVGMRLHALLFAAAQGVPVVPISYDPKVEALMRDLGEPPPLRAAQIQSSDIVGAVTEAMADLPSRRSRLLAAVAPLRARAAIAPAEAALLLEGSATSAGGSGVKDAV
jgi:polysaccharide pyruvyl transferase CsaB